MNVGARLARTAGQLLLALLNATLILVILAALAIGFAVSELREAAEEGAERVAAAALSAAETEPGEIRDALGALATEMTRLREVLRDDAEGERLSASLAEVEARLIEVRDALRALSSPAIRIDPATLEALGATLEALMDRLAGLRDHSPGAQ